MRGFALLAQAGRADRDPLMQPEVIWGTAGLAVALLVGAAFVYAVDKWRKQTAVRDIADPSGELTDYRGMFERGEITEQEYADLRGRVARRMKPVPAPPGPATPARLVPPPPAAGDAPPPDPGNPPTPPPPV